MTYQVDDDFIDHVARLAERVADLERRFENQDRYGTVEEVDPEKQRVRLRIGGTDDEPMLSPWVPYAQTAGALKVHSPPSKGQQMLIHAPDGDLRQGIASGMTWSNNNASPSQSGEEHVLTFGSVKIEMRDGELIATVGGSSIKMTDGNITLVSVRIDLN